MTYDEIKETLAGLHGEKAKKDMEDFLATPHPIERDEFTLRGNARDYKVTTVKGYPWDCNVSIPENTPSEMDAWLRSTGY
jgi:hypothetical protein